MKVYVLVEEGNSDDGQDATVLGVFSEEQKTKFENECSEKRVSMYFYHWHELELDKPIVSIRKQYHITLNVKCEKITYCRLDCQLVRAETCKNKNPWGWVPMHLDNIPNIKDIHVWADSEREAIKIVEDWFNEWKSHWPKDFTAEYTANNMIQFFKTSIGKVDPGVPEEFRNIFHRMRYDDK